MMQLTRTPSSPGHAPNKDQDKKDWNRKETHTNLIPVLPPGIIRSGLDQEAGLSPWPSLSTHSDKILCLVERESVGERLSEGFLVYPQFIVWF